MTGDELRGVLAWLIRCYHTNTREKIVKFTLPIVLRDTGEIVGWCGLGPLEFDASEVEIYFVIARECWGRGYATEAARALLGYAFDTIGLDRVVAVVDPANDASVRVIRKLGMCRERVVRGLPVEYKDYEGHELHSLCSRRRGQAADVSSRRSTEVPEPSSTLPVAANES